MNLEEYNKALDIATKEAMVSDLRPIDMIAVLELTKMGIAILMHEEARRQGVI